MKTITEKSLKALLKTRLTAMSKERDKLRKIMDDYDELAQVNDDAIESLQACVDKLSEIM